MAGEKILRLLFKKNVFGNWESKPIWEQITACLQYISLFLSILLLFDVGITTSIHCVPSNSTIKLTIPETDKANADCAAKLPHWLKYFPFENLLIILSVFAIDVMWTWIPRIQQTFKTLKECDEKIQSLGSVSHTRVVVRRMVEKEEQIEPMPTDDDLRKLKNICKDLWSLNPGFPKYLSISALYTLRSIISCVLIGVSLKVLYSVSTEDSQHCYLESGVTKELHCTFSYPGYGRSLLQSLIIVQWIFASYTALKIFAVPPHVEDVETNMLRFDAIYLGFRLGLYCLVMQFHVVYLFLATCFLGCFDVIVLGVSEEMRNYDSDVGTFIMYSYRFVEVPLVANPPIFHTTTSSIIYWSFFLAFHLIIIATSSQIRYRSDIKAGNEWLIKKVDNELALSFLRHSSNPLSRKTVAILIPTKVTEKRFVVEFLNR